MDLALEAAGCVVAVTHVRNLLATQTIIEHGDRDRVPVRGGLSTGALTVVERVDGVWEMRAGTDDSQPIPSQPALAEVRV